ncbi:glycoside hydrolase family 13 protein [Helcobacillus massiliensis]|uniref:glycoside hydrolase family 13 protein n=1 Tax=Helcobacillus massiliensis TaxID=521392 RepID=UPI0021A36988|nr:glycoside hydrolase family 13 protein [Helcobacillus massiliensis]MCT1558301.1 glycoside hydrolase family 13 protein [Helcobacillus massiliensis]MCT2037271.1 glycoside hydrolase family 13 protein [Helcobacillus massiliensis]MCT2332046.1 glycoside hydrolase family 13 protein [Helcobacillus massiliensis]MDK7742311.1 glycoside hydrolase family 13 protein [Helcobacillus massiliensis]WOO92052.1 glycoside hydrolase family 13 protein [Helcobacillus massiliensis]
MSNEWWRSAVVYQVYPRSFADGNGDGMGDLPGITARLEHIRDLGADAIWLSPFYTSPQHDAGYDVADFTDVDPRFGTLEDADALIARAHELGIRVIVDIVPNHSSSEHPLFRAALDAEPGSPEREMYIFRDGRGEHGEEPPNNWQSIFHGSAWTREEKHGQWYLHLFDTSQPDFNWTNRAVRDMFEGVLRFWLDRGVDGFRVDVAHGMIKPDGLPDESEEHRQLMAGDPDVVPVYFDQDGVHEIYREWRRVLDEYEGDRMMVAEAWVPKNRQHLYIRPDEMHQIFNFGFLGAGWSVDTITEAIMTPLTFAKEVGSPSTWVLSNHDVIRHATRYGFEHGYRFGEGLSREEKPDLELGLRRARGATALMLALPGSAYLYQGEEMGLPEVAEIPDELREDPAHKRAGVPGRDGCRVPLAWEKDSPAYGFSSTGKAWLPQPDFYGERAADQQDGVEGSTLEFYRTAIAQRRALGLATGDLVMNESPHEGVLSLTNAGVTVLVNTTDQDHDLPEGAEVLLASHPDAQTRLAANSTVWLR